VPNSEAIQKKRREGEEGAQSVLQSWITVSMFEEDGTTPKNFLKTLENRSEYESILGQVLKARC
jgi:hypothetical protein